MNVSHLVSAIKQLEQDQQVVIDIHGRLYDLVIVAPNEDTQNSINKVLLVPVNPPALRKFAEE